MRRHWRRLGALMLAMPALVGILAMPLAHAADWPDHPIRVVVPAPAGGPYDRTIRPIARHMSETLGQALVIDNRPSAGNVVGTQIGARAAPDGYTLTMTGMLNTIAQGMYEKLPFDIVRDFEPIGEIGQGDQWLVVRSDAGIATFQDLLAQAKSSPGKINYASSGTGSTAHLIMEQLQRATQTQFTHVPYKGAAPALQDVLAGVVPVIVVPPTSVLASVRAGQLKVLATSGQARSPSMPDVPTFAQLGYPQLTATSWVGLSAPKGTPAAIVDRINAALKAALSDPVVLKQLAAEGLTPVPSTPQQYGELVHADTERWGALVRSLQLKAD